MKCCSAASPAKRSAPSPSFRPAARSSSATDKVRVEMGEAIHLEPRDFMAVHMQAGEPCPRCGTAVSLIGANQRITNFCRTCQPGGLLKGM